jgi:hypothetical protein
MMGGGKFQISKNLTPKTACKQSPLAPQAAALIEGLPAEVVMADTAYDADHLRQAIAAKGALAV